MVASPWCEPRIVKPGTSSGAKATPRASSASATATPHPAIVFHGSSRSAAISAATSAIQPVLMTPRAKRAAMSPPAAGHAEPTALRPHAQGARAARAPVLAKEPPRVPTATQARILRARQLVQRAAEDHVSRQVATRLVPGDESEVERADAFDEHVAQQARYEPGDQIAGREGGGGPQARCPTTVRGHHW